MTDSYTPLNTCPSCAKKGKRVPTVTLRSLLRLECVEQIGDGEWLFCDSVGCDVVYFNTDGQKFTKGDLTVRVGIKEASDSPGPRKVCYCFDHTIESIEQEVQQTGQSTVLADIKTKMKDGCWCETTSPQGTCCLGTVGRYVKRSLVNHGHTAALAAVTDQGQEDCCASTGSATDDDVTGRVVRTGGLWAVTASAGAAVVASACCWLPLLLLTLGVSSAGVGGLFQALRPYMLSFAAVSLGLGFYFAYRKPACSPGSACYRSTHRQRGVLWASSVFVVAMALFPYYGGALLYGGASSPANNGPDVTASSKTTGVYHIKGMTCAACASGLQAMLTQLPGVASASVSYEEATAWVSMQSGKPDEQAIRDAVEAGGFSVIPGEGE